ncbi:Protein asteroid 1 [Thoreauomyces humboldtii]|nr:Protein asteroid 1 [Thoreauomyces humboldtii]
MESLTVALLHNVSRLVRVGIFPHFIFDGMLPSHKIEERKSRLTEKVSRIRSVMDDILLTSRDPSDLARHGSANLLPPLAMPACIHALRKAGHRVFVNPDGEADVELARLAHASDAPILSLDSDYFVYVTGREQGEGLGGGYMPYTSLRWRGDELHADLYKRANVADAMGLNQRLLPALAALVGCDYITHATRTYASQLEVLSPKLKGASRIQKVLAALRSQNTVGCPFEAVDAVLEPLKNCEQKRALRTALRAGADLTGNLPFPLLHRWLTLFSLDAALTHYMPCDELDDAPSPSPQPPRILDLFRQGRYDHRLTEIATQRTMWCSPFVEDLTRGSAWETSRGLRRWVYAITLWSCAPQDIAATWGTLPVDPKMSDDWHAGTLRMKEHLRRADRLVQENVDPVPYKDLARMVSKSDTLPSVLTLTTAERKAVRSRILDLDNPAAVKASRTEFTPLIASTRYLIRDLFARDRPIANHEVVAILCAGVLALLNLSSDSLSSTTTTTTDLVPSVVPRRATRSSLHRMAQLETVLYAYLSLSHSLLLATDDPEDEEDPSSTWRCIDGIEFHRCMEMAKGGASPERILGSVPDALEAYRMAWEAATWEVEDEMDLVIRYEKVAMEETRPVTAVSKVGGRTRRRKATATGAVGKGVGGSKKMSAPPVVSGTNFFDLLGTGCQF